MTQLPNNLMTSSAWYHRNQSSLSASSNPGTWVSLSSTMFHRCNRAEVKTRHHCRQIYPAIFPQISDLAGKFSILIPWKRNQGHFNVVVNLSVLSSVSGNRRAAKESIIILNPQLSVCIQSLALLKSVCILGTMCLDKGQQL